MMHMDCNPCRKGFIVWYVNNDKELCINIYEARIRPCSPGLTVSPCIPDPIDQSTPETIASESPNAALFSHPAHQAILFSIFCAHPSHP